ncbi:MAG TPA: tetratricopeptide repeat protein [Bryobacteraceae bacterium]|nr:tetratricopeptide repeat protein [Bryobacteraceae bacterium]
MRLTISAFLVCALGTASAAEKGQLDFSPSLFTVMAAINAAGYDADMASPNNDPLRAEIRKAVAAAKPPVTADLKNFFAAHRQKDETAELSQYVSFALSVNGPPDFAYKFRTVELPPDIRALEGLAPLLARFYREANIEELWNKVQPAFERVIERYQAPVSRAVLEANAYLRNPTAGYLGRSFQIYLDVLAAPNQVQTRSYANEYFVVVTPSPDLRVDDIRHAYLHYLLDPLATKYGVEILKRNSLVDFAQGAPALDAVYKSDFLLLTTESLIKAVEARLPGHPETVDDALHEGYILTPFFAEQLTAYEKQPGAMRLYFPEMLKHLDVNHESRRLDQVQFAEKPHMRPAVTAVERRPESTPAAKTIEEAERLYRNKDYDGARQVYLRALEESSEKSEHALAYYGLARIAVLKNDPELGERLFQKALDSSPDAWVKAWVHVYLGRLSDIAGNREEAAKHYQMALAIDGASAGARQAAQRGIQEAFKKN